MKIAMLPGSISRRSGGLFTSVRRLSISLLDTGAATVDVIGDVDEFTAADLPQWDPIVPRVLNMRRGWGIGNELATVLRDVKPEIVHRHFLWQYATTGGSRFLREHPGKLIVSPRGMLDPWAVKHRRLKKFVAGKLFENSSLRSAACMHALNASEAESIRAYGLTNPICIVPNGIDLPTPSSAADASGAGQSTSVHTDPHEQRRLLFLGRIHSKKGLGPFLKGWDLARTALGAWKLLIAGWDDGNEEAALKKQVVALNLQESVEFVGPKHGDDKASLLKSCDAFVLPSFSEGLPMTVLEAWANQLPVLMTPQCNLPIGFSSGAAIQIDPIPESAAEGLRRLARTPPDELRRMGAIGLDLVQKEFSWQVVARKMLSVYRWVLGQGPKPDCVLSV